MFTIFFRATSRLPIRQLVDCNICQNPTDMTLRTLVYGWKRQCALFEAQVLANNKRALKADSDGATQILNEAGAAQKDGTQCISKPQVE